ncbi:4-hydroxythreonine-4-phosphate dehydrogenase PdxA [Paucibacter sp. APW11]|uniref:4-hydroxythreonine-4-phosphate dehydrogenase PdxA n=1 Tax=Roseateles aquae TaxID=3077235 RepID=A0ABU3PFV3_9BURK|nr:4-hydroxythreonine-4-phosphate dehydrogenase PdxA [Paucibacter sp. APW11]MDT9001418.1 4-hydroxythreonine-4-phosphate dehydrogenase PdxA [Paucibacter sp. APW11]
MNAPLLLTMGDACGIGPEISVRAWLAEASAQAPLCLVGDVAVLRRALRQCAIALPLARLQSLDEWACVPPDCLPVWQPAGLPADLIEVPQGRISALAGAAAVRCIEAAVAAVQAGQADGLVTAPIHKEALHAAGVSHPGHTELLQALAAQEGSLPPVRMMLANEELRTVLVTIHVSLREAISLIGRERVLETITITAAALQRCGIAAPRIAVAGLNPHAGEGGLFGDEELLHIAPAIAAAQALGLNVSGPYAPDTVFMRARNAPGHPGEFDAVVAMTHDHALIPVKYLGVEQGVNVTLGLPFVRTSPDHGTAFDIAGQGRADVSSMRAAIRMAWQLSGAR